MTEKACTVCGEVKSLAEFHRNHRMKDGHINQCKPCRRPQSRRWNRENSDRMRLAKSAFKERHPDYNAKYVRAWKRANPEKRRAHNTLERAVRSGKIKRPESCSRCQAAGAVEGHHPDYSKPLEVEWLCRRCHAAEHRQLPELEVLQND